ncbi:recombination protein RecR [Candidatus Wolfebacteria bacterium]|nr:recombination protein RecR [Candidatus Wolfebacteria bacterium]
MLPEPIKKFIEIFSVLPGIGIRQATRLAFKLIDGGRNKIEETAMAISNLKRLKICQQCFFVHQNKNNLCNICNDPKREKDIIIIVEKETDLISLERTKKFNGQYLILGELSKTGNLEPVQKLRLNHFKDRIKKEFSGQIKEIIIATNPTTYGDLNASIITKELSLFAQKITRLGRGIPTGGEIEFADEKTLEQALERRI